MRQSCRNAVRRWKTSDAAFRTEKEQKGVSPAASLRRKRPSASLGGDGSKDRPGRSGRRIRAHALPSARCRAMRGTPRAGGTLCGRARQSGVQPHAAPEGCLDLPAAVCTRTAQLGDDGARTAARGTHACPDVQCISAGAGACGARRSPPLRSIRPKAAAPTARAHGVRPPPRIKAARQGPTGNTGVGSVSWGGLLSKTAGKSGLQLCL